MTINQIIKRTLERLKRENKQITPEFYREAFCKEAKAAGIIVEDCNQVQKHTSKLDKSLQDELKQYRVKSLNELITYFVAKLNRTNPAESNSQNTALNTLLKRILQTIASMHNAELSALSTKSIKDLDLVTNANQIEKIKDNWVVFLTSYDDSFLDILKPYGKVNKHDIKNTLENLKMDSKTAGNVGDYQNLALLFVSSFVPSIASSVNEELAELSQEIRENPQSLNTQAMMSSIKEAIKLRISIDKAHIKKMLSALDSVLEKLSIQILALIDRTDHSGKEISNIKKNLENLEIGENDDFKSAHKKLYTIASSLEEETKLLGFELKEHNKEVSEMENKIKALEKELTIAKKASREDALTKLYNKRALDEFLEIREGEFKRYKKPYSVVFFDIDLFKIVNDTYGHDAGDIVLKGFAQVFKKLARNVDIVGRYGGEEFLAILSETDHKGAQVFAEKVRAKLEISRFIHEGRKLKVTISGGIAYREEFPSIKQMMKSADDKLYQAKENGRNQIVQ
ncbi:diguanylate cyclase [Sulfurimonas sp. MAG313]|nr:diguanylate cyclase [Sulfurimonas sp. MAG313]MDF1881731.1 diguanylate cyclase [Sulfurimonas sp. MAG313]